MAGINFLADQQRLASEQAKKDRQYLWIGVSLLVAVLLAWGGFWGYNFYLTGKVAELSAERDTKTVNLERYAQSQTPYLIFVNKVKVIAEIIASRHSGLQLIKDTGDYINTEGILMRSANFKMRERYFESNIEASDVFKMTALYDKLSKEEFRVNYESIDYGSLSRNSTGRYNTTMKFNI